MGRRREYDHVGRIDVFREKPPKNESPWPGIIAVGVVILIIMASCGG